jgi:hypothetical protein
MTDETKQATPYAETSAEDKFFGVRTTIDTSPEPPAAKGEKESAPAIEIETDDDGPPTKPVAATPPKTEAGADDDDLASYSEKVQRRIKRMTWEKNEEKRQRTSAEKIRDEAVRVAQVLHQKNQESQHIIANGEAYLIDQIKTKAGLALDKSRAEYVKANEEGDTEALLRAQEGLMQAQAEARAVQDYEADYQQRVWQAQQQPPQQPYRPPTPQVPPPSQQSAAWADRNPWFGNNKHKDMTALAYGIHERLVRDEGFAPDSDEYFQAIDGEMQARFPDYFEQGGQQPAPTQRRTTPVAPAQRNNGARPRKVKLTQSQVSLAKKLGITPEQYANELTRGM